MSDRIDPIDPKLRSLLDGEAAGPFTNGEMRARILSGVTGAIGGPGGASTPDGGAPSGGAPPAPPGPGLGTAASVLAKPLGSLLGVGVMSAIFAAGVVVGTQVTSTPATRPAVSPALERPRTRPRVSPPLAPTAPPAVTPTPGPVPVERTVRRRPEPRRLPPSGAGSERLRAESGGRALAERAPQTPLAEEQRVIERARTALARGFYDDALAALREHARRFPEGALAADRDGLTALVLSRAGRTEEARRAAEVYLSAHPNGTLAPAVRSVLEVHE